MTLGVRLLLALVVIVDVSVAVAQSDRLQTIINGTPLTEQQKAEFRRMYGVAPLAGDFWYDARSGLWGVKGREAFGILRPGHNFGTLAQTASAGTTGVFINGRQITWRKLSTFAPPRVGRPRQAVAHRRHASMKLAARAGLEPKCRWT
jgi:hypothetical protein